MIPRIRGSSSGICKMSISYVLMTLAIAITTKIEAFDVSSRTSCTFTQQTSTTILQPYTAKSTPQQKQLTMKVSGGSKRTRSLEG